MKKSGASQGQSASELISKRIAELGDWRGETLSRMRKLIKEADPDVVEEWKWMGTPIWSHDGIICTGESYKNVVKLTFSKGASLKDPARLFNSSLDGNVRRAIDIHEGEEVDETAFRALSRIDVVLIAHGELPDQSACEDSVASALHALQTNAVSVVSLLTLIGKRMQLQGSGVIAVIGSVAGDRGRKSNYVYGSGKALVAVFSQGLADRLQASGDPRLA